MTGAAGARSVQVRMRAPIKSESDAFRFTMAATGVIAASLLIGWATEPVVGIAVFAAAALVAAGAYVVVGRRDRRPVLREAAGEPHPHGAPGRRHVLVVANIALSGDELRERILAAASRDTEFDILAPVLSSRVHYTVSDVDDELAEARDRLRRSLAWADRAGLAARGEIGDPSPTTALEDELRDFSADEVIVVTHPPETETWQEQAELERLRRELDVPVWHFSVDGGVAEATP